MQPTTPVSAGRAGNSPKNLRRRGPAAPSTPSARWTRTTFREDVGHAAAETYLVSRLAFILLRSLG